MKRLRDIAVSLVLAAGLLAVANAVPLGGAGSANGHELKGYHTYHGGMSVYENTDAFTIDDANTWHLFYDDAWAGYDHLQDVTFSPGSTGAITAFADAGGGLITATSVGHGLSANDTVSITGTANYQGVFQVISAPTSDTFTFTDTWVATETGTFNHSGGLTADKAGMFVFLWSLSIKPATVNDEFAFQLYSGFTAGVADSVPMSEQHVTTAQNTKFSPGFGFAEIHMVAGQQVHFGLKNVSDAGDPTIRYCNVLIHQL